MAGIGRLKHRFQTKIPWFSATQALLFHCPGQHLHYTFADVFADSKTPGFNLLPTDFPTFLA
jgi:hypothetical protein